MRIRVGTSVPLQTEESYRKQLGDAIEEQAFREAIEDRIVQTIFRRSLEPRLSLSLVTRGIEIDEEITSAIEQHAEIGPCLCGKTHNPEEK